MRGYFAEYMFKYYPFIILRDELLEGFVGEGCDRTKDGIGNGLGKSSVHDDVSLTGFVMEELYHRRKQKVKKVF